MSEGYWNDEGYWVFGSSLEEVSGAEAVASAGLGIFERAAVLLRSEGREPDRTLTPHPTGSRGSGLYREEIMKLYTSHWRNQELASLDVVPVGISRGVPRGKLAKELPYHYKRLPAPVPPNAAGSSTTIEYPFAVTSVHRPLPVRAVT